MTGIFGGSFDPPHVGHLIVAETVRDQFGLDEVVWMPAYAPPHKVGGERASAAQRLHMTRLAIAGNPFFSVSDLELRRGGISYTVDTVQELQKANPGTAYALIVGGDSFRQFHSWRDPQRILDRVPLLVYGRNAEEPPTLHPSLHGDVGLVQAPFLDISSTRIRAARREGRSLRYLVPEAARLYVEEQQLYVPGVRSYPTADD